MAIKRVPLQPFHRMQMLVFIKPPDKLQVVLPKLDSQHNPRDDSCAGPTSKLLLDRTTVSDPSGTTECAATPAAPEP